MTERGPEHSRRREELLDLAYRYVCAHGLAELSLRPLAAATGTSPRVLIYLFGSKDGLVRALLSRSRGEELAMLDRLRLATEADHPPGLGTLASRVWEWLAATESRGVLSLWVEGYGRSLIDPDGPWGGFARSTVEDWLALLAAAQPAERRDTAAGRAECTLVLAVLRGALLDLLATGERERVTAAVTAQLAALPD